MVGAVLGVVFDDEDGGVIPIRTVRDGLDDAAYGEVVIGDGSGWARLGLGAMGVIVGKIEQDKRRELSFFVFFVIVSSHEVHRTR